MVAVCNDGSCSERKLLSADRPACSNDLNVLSIFVSVSKVTASCAKPGKNDSEGSVVGMTACLEAECLLDTTDGVEVLRHLAWSDGRYADPEAQALEKTDGDVARTRDVHGVADSVVLEQEVTPPGCARELRNALEVDDRGYRTRKGKLQRYVHHGNHRWYDRT